MTPLDHAVREITQALEVLRIPYAVVGGIANAVWGEPLATIDVDVTVAVDDADLPTTVPAIARSFRVPVPDPVALFSRPVCCRSIPLTASEST